EENQEVGSRAPVALRAVPTGYSASSVRRPATLPKGIEAESGDQIGPTFDAVSSCAESRDESRSHVDPSRNGQTETRFNASGVRDDCVKSGFRLQGLLWQLRVVDRRQEQKESKRYTNADLRTTHHAALERARPRQTAIV